LEIAQRLDLQGSWQRRVAKLGNKRGRITNRMEEQLTSAFASLGCHTGQKQIRADVAAYVGVPKSSSMKRSNASTSERLA